MQRAPGGKTLTVIGLGNIGSHLTVQVARMPDVRTVVLVDRDAYSPENIESQQVFRSDLARPKALAQARTLKKIRPELCVVPICDDVRNVPVGRLRADLMLACLDSRVARQYVNEIAWRLSMPWVDAGVRADGMLARVNAYAPDLGGPCLECGWEQQDYDLLEQAYPCSGQATDTTPTGAPASLGALAASLQAIECRKLLDGDLGFAAAGGQILIDLNSRAHYVTSSRRNSQCRFDHRSWEIRELHCDPRCFTLSDLFDHAVREGAQGLLRLAVEGKAFARAVLCPSCGRTRRVLGLLHRLTRRQVTCGCGERMVAAGFDRVRNLERASLGESELALPLGRLGLLPGDVATVRSPERDLHYEMRDGLR